MITNILQMLHTTAAYQTAAAQLMVNEANFAARQLGLNETVPPVAAMNTNQWYVEPPPDGIGGSVEGPNYNFYFHRGKLSAVRENTRFHSTSPLARSVEDLAKQPSLLDTNGAYQMATQRLAALSIDVAKLEREFPPFVFQVRTLKHDAEGNRLPREAGYIESPLFLLGWGKNERFQKILASAGRTNAPANRTRVRRPAPDDVINIEILGSTREVLSVDIRDASLLNRRALELTNAAELLGPLPPPQHFVEELVGGKEAFQTIASPDKVEAWLLASLSEGNYDRTTATPLTAENAKEFSNALLDFNSYLWNMSKACIMDPGARLRFTRGKDVVDVRLCYQCNELQILHNGKGRIMDFDPGRNALVKALQKAFPKDQLVGSLAPNGY